jgi:N-sulfoglucosamine sulfohydrolase
MPSRITLLLLTALLLPAATPLVHASADAARPNLLIVTVDDMSCDSVGAFGCKLAGTTPHMDRLASQGRRFALAHVQVGNCMPSRNVMWSGRYPHTNGVEGFYQVRSVAYPVLADLMREAGYFTAIRGKVNHSTPYSPYNWDLVLDQIDGQPLHVKDPATYYQCTQVGIASSRAAGKPFCLMVNISDPHLPFYAWRGRRGEFDDPHRPSRIFTADEVPVPGFLPDHPDIRRELAHYYSSVRRADDCLGGILQALDESGQAEQTVVLFLSDHGMPLPFAKTGVWHHSTHTPLVFRWPGVTTPGSVDNRHMVSAVDLLPTLLDIAGIGHPEGLQGQSLLPLVRGEPQQGRDYIVKEDNENAGGFRNPMRSIQSRRFGYIFSPWVNGTRTFRTATTGTLTYLTMKQLAARDPQVAARLKLFEQGVREEFYDYENDPDALTNLVDDPRYQDELNRHRQALDEWMQRTDDPLLEVFRQRHDDAACESFMSAVEAEAAARKQRPARPSRRPAADRP